MSFDFASYPRLEIPEGRVKKITRQSDGLVLWEAGYINMVPLSINADGTIYNGTGYKNGCRVRSGGAEGEMANAACTGFIPVRGGDVVRIYGWTRYSASGNAANAINAADSAFTNLGQIGNSNYGIFAGAYAAYNNSTIADGADGISTWVVPPASSGVAYIRVSGFGGDSSGGAPGARLIVTVNEEIL